MLSSLPTRTTKTTRQPVWNFQGHINAVWSVAFSPNGDYVLTGSWDDTAKLWNVKNGTLVHTFQGHINAVWSVAFSPNGDYVLTGSNDNTAKLWNVKNGTLVHTFQGHTNTVRSVAFSPNGDSVLTGSGDNTAKLWNVKNGTLVHTFQGHTSYVWSVAFSPNGDYVLTGSLDKTAKLWNVKNGILVHTFQGHANSVYSVAFSPNGDYVLTGSDDKTAKLWNVKNGILVHTFQGHTNYVYSVAFSPNGDYVLTGSWDDTAKLWNVKNGTLVHTFQGHTNGVSSVAFSPNGDYVLTGSRDDTAKLWNVKNGTLVHTFQGHANPVRSVAFSPNGDYVLTGSYDKTAKLWNVKNGTLVHTFQGHANSVYSVAFSPNGDYVLTGSRDKTAKLWNVPKPLIPHRTDLETASQLSTNDVSGAPEKILRPETDSITSTNQNITGQTQHNPINLKLLEELKKKEEYLLNLINHSSNIEKGLSLLSQYPNELQSILYEKTQSKQEEVELSAILSSREHREFYIHLVCKLNGMMKACETIACGMVSEADGSFQDYVRGLIVDGTVTAVNKIDLGKALGGVVEWTKKQLGSIPFADAIGSFLQLACEFKTKRKQRLAIGRVAFISALADVKEQNRGGINGTVNQVARCIVRAKALELTQLQSQKFGRMKQVWTKAMAISSDTPAKEQGCSAADSVISIIMKPKKNTDLHSVMEGHSINQSILMHEIIVSAALDRSIDDVRSLAFFSGSESNENGDESGSSPPTPQYSSIEPPVGVRLSAIDDTKPNQTNDSGKSEDVTTREELEEIQKQMKELLIENEKLRKQNETVIKQNETVIKELRIENEKSRKQMKELRIENEKLRKQNETLIKQNETVIKKVAKLEKEKKETEVDGGDGLCQSYENQYQDSTHHTTKHIDRLEINLVEMQKNLFHVNEILVEHDEHLKEKSTLMKESIDYSQEAEEKRKREANEKRKRIERERLELLGPMKQQNKMHG